MATDRGTRSQQGLPRPLQHLPRQLAREDLPSLPPRHLLVAEVRRSPVRVAADFIVIAVSGPPVDQGSRWTDPPWSRFCSLLYVICRHVRSILRARRLKSTSEALRRYDSREAAWPVLGRRRRATWVRLFRGSFPFRSFISLLNEQQQAWGGDEPFQIRRRQAQTVRRNSWVHRLRTLHIGPTPYPHDRGGPVHPVAVAGVDRPQCTGFARIQEECHSLRRSGPRIESSQRVFLRAEVSEGHGDTQSQQQPPRACGPKILPFAGLWRP
jgi:hypothetical protein